MTFTDILHVSEYIISYYMRNNINSCSANTLIGKSQVFELFSKYTYW